MGHGTMTGSNTPGAQDPVNMARVFAALPNRCSVLPGTMSFDALVLAVMEVVTAEKSVLAESQFFKIIFVTDWFNLSP